jgi:glycosyltransferase involved in cell wall biosynthesis
MAPLLTIGLPVYNPGAFLTQSLRSVFAQTFQDWELILVDDGSDDGSWELLCKIHDPRVRLLKSGPKPGLAARLNQIVLAARAPYIARMDADDMQDCSRLERQVKFLQDHPQVDVVGCALVILDGRGRPTGLRRFATEHARICAKPLIGIQLAHPTVVGKTEWFRRYPYNEENRSCEDWELWFSSYKTSRFANLYDPIYYYREFSSFSIRKYINAKRHIARLQWRQRAGFGLVWTLHACASQYVRIVLNLCAYFIGLKNYMIRRRSKPIDNHTCTHVLAADQVISNMPLPLIVAASPMATQSVGNRNICADTCATLTKIDGAAAIQTNPFG